MSRKIPGVLLAALIIAFAVTPCLSVFAGGSSSGGGGGGSAIWPFITKRILLPDNHKSFVGNVTFDIKVTLVNDGKGGPTLSPMVKKEAFSISFSGAEEIKDNAVESIFDFKDVQNQVYDMIEELQKQLPPHTSPNQKFTVDISESESNSNALSPADSKTNSATITVERSVGPNDMILYNVKSTEETIRFINRYTPPNEPPEEPECPDDECCSGCCPDINININNENNSSANNNNTNVGRDQYNNGNQGINPNLKLDRFNHFAYVHGYPDHSFRPEGSITRGEMTAIFRRLLDQGTFMGGSATPFNDVRAGDWCASDVSRLSSLGVISGYPDGSFRPNASVTRAEFAAVASKFAYAKSGQGFSDVNGHWAQSAIEKLRNAGWITGYGDGSFRPDSVITRAEVVSITNRMLDRVADANYIQRHQGSLAQYNDLPSGHWAYLPIMEASNAHDYIRNADGSETWTRHWK